MPRISYDLWNTKEIKALNAEIDLVKKKEKTMYRAAKDLEKILQRSYASIYAQLQRGKIKEDKNG